MIKLLKFSKMKKMPKTGGWDAFPWGVGTVMSVATMKPLQEPKLKRNVERASRTTSVEGICDCGASG